MNSEMIIAEHIPMEDWDEDAYLQHEYYMNNLLDDRFYALMRQVLVMTNEEVHKVGSYKSEEEVMIAMLWEAHQQGLAAEVYGQYKQYRHLDVKEDEIDVFFNCASDALYEWDC